MYGITEVTVHASFQRLAEGQLPGGPSLIGRLLPHFEYQLVDVDHHLGTARGELLLAGPQVGTSYLNAQQQSAERFIFRDGRCWYRTGDIVEDRSGQLRYVGRVDRQVQIRGFRVELAEVEFALRNIPGVISAKVCIERTNKDEPVLLAVVESANRSATDIRLEMTRTVPAFLVPARIEVVREMPLSATGKASVGAR
jgi:acyl-CoA synthetase (AMP-forming)/AMP-acid ligase II